MELKIARNFELQRLEYVNDARRYVYRHRSILNDSTKRYIERTYPAPIIKEVGTFQGEKSYMYWVFIPCTYGTFIYVVEREDGKKLTKKQLLRLFEIQSKVYKAVNNFNNKATIVKFINKLYQPVYKI